MAASTTIDIVCNSSGSSNNECSDELFIDLTKNLNKYFEDFEQEDYDNLIEDINLIRNNEEMNNNNDTCSINTLDLLKSAAIMLNSQQYDDQSSYLVDETSPFEMSPLTSNSSDIQIMNNKHKKFKNNNKNKNNNPNKFDEYLLLNNNTSTPTTSNKRLPKSKTKRDKRSSLNSSNDLDREIDDELCQLFTNQNENLQINKTKFNYDDYVCINEKKCGHIRYEGKVHFADGIFCGIELEEADGKHDGKIDGIRYVIIYICSNP